MGCWNETCMLTGLPILSGEKAVGIFITRKPKTDNSCYSDSFYSPVSLPFYGEYDEYGCLENIERNDKALSAFSRAGLYEKNGNSYVPAGPKLAGYTKFLEEIIRLAVECNLYIKQNETYEPVWFVLMRQEFFDFLVREIGEIEPEVYESVTFRVRLHQALRTPLKEGTISTDNLLPMIRLMFAMDMQRLSWHPTTGTGSQSCLDMDWQERFYSKIAATASSLRWDEQA